MAIINHRGYLQGIGDKVVWIVREFPDGRGYLNLTFPKSYVGKRFYLKVEEAQDDAPN